MSAWAPPPSCREHPGGHVVRDGTYGKRAHRRQRYRCYPDPVGRESYHRFTPPLPRDYVVAGADQCDECEEHRGIHHGEMSVARRHSWPARVVARALADLSAGGSYGDVSRWALRAVGRVPPGVADRSVVEAAEPVDEAEEDVDDELVDEDRGEAAEPVDEDGAAAPPEKPKSAGTAASNNAWHIAADWTEAFAPAIFGPLDARLRAAAVTERERLDDLIADGKAASPPQVVLLDDVPVYGRAYGQEKARRDEGFFVLVAGEYHWQQDGRDASDDFFAVPPTGEPKLRLVRAMAKSNSRAWRLLFNELDYTPDFIVADAGTGIAKAVRDHFDPARTRLVPSLWHVSRAVRQALTKTQGATVAHADGRRLRQELSEHLAQLTSDGRALVNAAGWRQWWLDLEQLCVTLNLPVDKVRRLCVLYESQFADAIDALAANPGVPLSTGGLETLIAKRVIPLLERRRTGFANIERTNSLFDLIVARDHGSFDNLAAVAKLLRADATKHDGWTVPLREVTDPQPPNGRYSSLRDPTLLAEIAKQRGIA